MRILYCFVFLLIGFQGITQNFEDQWTGLFSYNHTTDISQGSDKLIVAAENAFFAYDLTLNELEKTSSVNGLSGELFSSIYYSESFGLTILGYENGLMEIVIDGDEDILTVVDILDKPTIPPNMKRINHFNEYNGNLYISTDYGISVYDLNFLEFGDTYFIGDFGAQILIHQTAVLGDYIYASTNFDGVKRALVEADNLIDFDQWETFFPFASVGVEVFSENLYVARTGGVISRLVGGSLVTLETLSEIIIDIRSNSEYLIVATKHQVHVYDADFTKVAFITSLPDFNYTLSSATAINNTMYLGTLEFGILAVPFGSLEAEQILPNGPLLNQSFAIDVTPGQLWTVFGDVTTTFNPFPLSNHGISHFKNNEWKNFSYEETFLANDLVNVVINKEDTTQVFMSSFNKGLLKIDNGTPSILFDDTNSPLESHLSDERDIRIYGADFDRDGNLWFVQSRVEDGLKRLASGGSINSIDVTSIVAEGELALTELQISREGFVFFGTTSNGLIGYNPNTSTFNKITEGIGAGNLPNSDVRALAFDNNNRLWIGATDGLRVLFNVGGFFEEGANTEAQQIIILEDGVAQELLFEQTITDIKVDGSNNKWISTANSGVFYFSANGQETLLRFTKDNSPLPSNNVQSIAIDGESGVVYFATINGLVAFNGRATSPGDDLEGLYVFPNPVRPNFMGSVTINGLTAKANIKITDIEGNLVYETVSEGGSVQWDTRAFGKYKVASGVYFVLVTTRDALETNVAKIMIVR